MKWIILMMVLNLGALECVASSSDDFVVVDNNGEEVFPEVAAPINEEKGIQLLAVEDNTDAKLTQENTTLPIAPLVPVHSYMQYQEELSLTIFAGIIMCGIVIVVKVLSHPSLK